MGRIWLIAGPTASGKSALALRLAQAIGADVVNADALQLYRDLRVLTARPSPEEEARAPHRLFGIADAADGWSVGRWLAAAREVLADGRPAVVVGGTGLYLRALTQGLAHIPPVPAAARRAVEARFETLGEPAFRAELAAHDPAAADRIAPGDRQRLCRAMEVFEATGRPLTAWQSQTEGGLDEPWRAVALEPPREMLYARCDARLEAMAREGAVEEARALTARGLSPSLPAMKAVGLRELAADPPDLAAAQQATRRYAKRQLTWLRGQMADWPRITAPDADGQWRQFLALNPSLTASD